MKFLTTIFILALTFSAAAQQKVTLRSPDGKIVFNFSLLNKMPAYGITFQGKPLINDSPVSLSFNGRTFGGNLRMLKTTYRRGVEDYTLVVGKTSHVHDEYREAVIPLEDEQQTARVNVVVRAFNDAVAFRYEFISIKGQDSLMLTDERTTFRFVSDPLIHALPLPSYTSSHEGFYSTLPLHEWKDGDLMDMPVLTELYGAAYVAITEAALVDYAGMYLTTENGLLRSMLSPRRDQPALKVRAKLPHKSPWRVLMISDRIGDLIESNIITDLNEPCALQDVSWIKPGKTTFPWWNGNVVPDTLNAPGNNFVTQQYYIDFCARNGLEYHSVVEYGLHQWYVDDGVNFQPGPHSDVTRPVPGLDMKEVCDYARSKGVGVRVWVHWAALYPRLDSAFAAFERWGLQGMMIDFMDRDDQQMVNMQHSMLQKAAAHHLHVQFHGAYKPTGLSRTYPNEFTREGTLNYEINKWDDHGLPPEHDAMIPFTRMLAGSTDYHLGGFRAVPRAEYIRQYTRPLMLGTRCHMLAMYVVLENYLAMVCDYPVAYEGQPGFDFIKEVPTVWDETKVIDATPGEYIAIARRKGKDWYIGAITNDLMELTLPLDFLPPGTYQSTLYTDTDDAATNPNHLQTTSSTITPSTTLTIPLSKAGGTAAHLKWQQ